ncbi:MAG: carbon-nitrogen hydrolase family protein [Cyclobacteriaceae bacterium]
MPAKQFVGAIIQHGPEYLDKKKSLDKAMALAEMAAKKGANYLVFGETWLSGYPAWLDHCPNVANWDAEPVKEVFAKMYANGITVPGPEVDVLCKLAKNLKTGISIGVNEIVDSGSKNGTIYNTLLLINESGALVNHHRKLMPTFTEKMLYGHGDGNGLKSGEVNGTKVGGLICWEHWMPLSRQAMHNSGELVHAAVWPNVTEMLQIASRSYAFEGRCFVFTAGQIMRANEIPKELDLPEKFQNDANALVLRGGSAIIGPDGRYLVEPVFDKEDILIAELDLQKVYKEKMALDVTGHYQREDVFEFNVNSKRQ